MGHKDSSKAVVAEGAIGELPLLQRVQEMLGVHRLRSDQELVGLVEQGLSTQTLES
jgi:hypothetical protein